MKKKHLLFIPLLVTYMSINAQELEKALIVEMKNGEMAAFTLVQDNPKIRFANDSLVVSTSSFEFKYATSSVQRYTFGMAKSSGINTPKVDAYSFDGENMTLNVGKPYSTVIVYSVDGKAVAKATSEENGIAKVSLSGLSAGVYIVSSNNFSTKIIKR